MHPRGPEESYLRHIEPPKRETGRGFEAEETVIEFFEQNFPNMQTRTSTPKEDAGHFGQGVESKAVDVVVSKKGERRDIPAMAIQVTTNDDRWAVEKKIKEMTQMPFVNLRESRLGDPSVPRILIFLKPEDVRDYAQDRIFDSHPNISQKILDDAEKSLKFSMSRTKDQKTKLHIGELLKNVQDTKQRLLKNKKGIA